jgi:hypothetical protein
MEERGLDEEKEGKKNHRDPVIPLGEAHRFLFNPFLRGSQPCGVRNPYWRSLGIIGNPKDRITKMNPKIYSTGLTL